MEEAELSLEYIEFDFETTGMRCPECGMAFFDEQQIKKLVEIEEALEQK